MSKKKESMQQVPEIAAFAFDHMFQLVGRRGVLLRCSMMLMMALAAAACHQQSGAAQTKMEERVLKRGLPGEPRTLDPQLAEDDFSLQVLRDLYEGLTAEDAAGRVVPGAASSWTLDSTGTTYTFHLRPDAKWSNGDRLKSTEFVQGLRRAVDPKSASGSAGLLAVIKSASDIIAGRKSVSELGATSLDESTIRIELEHPAPFVLQILSQPIAAPVHETANVTSASEQSGKNAGPYNGPYILVDRVPGSFIGLVRNPNYWNSSRVSIENVRYVNAESEATELREYISGQLDMTFTIPLPDLNRISQKLGSEVQIATTLGTSYLALNLTKQPLKDDLALRQALSIAIDRELIAENVMVGVVPAYTFVANGSSGYDPPKYEWANWSRDRQLAYARSLFARAGYSERNPLHLKLYFSSGEGIQRTMIAIAGSWKQNLGVVSELASDEFRVFLAGRKDRNRWDVARLKWDADYDDPSSFLDVLSKGNSQNDPAYDSPSFNSLIEQARFEPRPDIRLTLLRKAEQVMLDDYPIIPVYFTRSRRLVKPYIGGAQINPMNRTYSRNLFWK
jgi:oligopeptide transport system substrate-binding protein